LTQDKEITKRLGGRPTNQQAAELTTRIVALATRLFLDKGYAATGMEEIAGIAGVAKRSLYSRFPTKEDLFRTVVQSYSKATLGLLDGRKGSGPLDERLVAGCLQVLDIALAPDVIAMDRLSSSESVRFPEVAQTIAAAKHEGLAFFTTILRDHPDAAGKTEDVFHQGARRLWDVAIAPEIRASVLAPRPEGVTAIVRSEVKKSVRFFLEGYRSAV
jgi:AcrR family transcriptional regulator